MLVFEIINERVVDEVSAQKRAYDAYKQVTKAVSANNFIEIELSDGNRNFYGLEPNKIGLIDVPPNWIIMIGLKTSNKSVFDGAIWKINDGRWMGKYTRVLVVYALDKYNVDSLKKCVNTTSFLETFMHEFIHLIDDQRTQGRINAREPEDPKTNRSGYLNDPAEFNAYFHQFAHNWLNCLAETQEHPEDLADLMDLYGISGNFEIDLKKLVNQSHYSKVFFKTLDETRRKSILRRLYRLYQEILSFKTT